MTSRYRLDPALYIEGQIRQVGPRRNGSFGDVSPVYIDGAASLPQKVALKRLRYSDDPVFNNKMQHALEKEITVLQIVNHPHVITLHGLALEFEQACIVMAWMEKGSLRQYLKKETRADKVLLLAQVADAIAYLHSGTATPTRSKIIHGDIHAGNILIDDNGKALLGDFGLCKLVPVGEIASLTQRYGSPDGVTLYMAPELHEPNALRSTASDVFAFGILIAETYNAGAVPQLPSNPASDAERIDLLKKGERPLRSPGMRVEVWDLARACWSAIPTDRPSMANVAARLKALN